MVRPVIVAVFAALVWSASFCAAQSPLVEELKTVSRHYHEDPRELDRLVAGLEHATVVDPHASNFIALSQASFLWGEVRATTREQRLDTFERGRTAGGRAIELLPREPEAHFWYAMNTARWGQVHGVLRSLFLLPTLKQQIRTILEIDPTFTPAYVLGGNIFYEVPGFLGGDIKRAEEMFRTALAQDPRFTAARVGLARTLVKEARFADARHEAQAVLRESVPRNLAEWTVHDATDAQELLDALE